MEKNLLSLRRILAKFAIFLIILNFNTLCQAQSSESSASSVITGSEAFLTSGGAVIIDYKTKDSAVVFHAHKRKITKVSRKVSSHYTKRKEVPKKVQYSNNKPNLVLYTAKSSQKVNKKNAHRSATTVVPHFRINFVALVDAVPVFSPYLYNARELVFFDNDVILDDYRRIRFFTRPPPFFVG